MGMREHDTIDVELDFLHYALVVDKTRAQRWMLMGGFQFNRR